MFGHKQFQIKFVEKMHAGTNWGHLGYRRYVPLQRSVQPSIFLRSVKGNPSTLFGFVFTRFLSQKQANRNSGIRLWLWPPQPSRTERVNRASGIKLNKTLANCRKKLSSSK